MSMLYLNVAALAVAIVYCLYATHLRILQRRQRQVRERVAYMLWTMAERIDDRELFPRRRVNLV
jgi:hypothetical protein